MTDDDRNEAMLEGHFAASKQAAPGPSETLLARILADADASQPTGRAPMHRPARRSGVWQVLQELGGWPVFAGLASAAVAGVVIGLAAPAALSAQAQDLLALGLTDDSATYLLDMAPDTMFAFAEGVQ